MRLTVYAGHRAAAMRWADDHDKDPRQVVALTEGPRRLQGLTYCPEMVNEGCPLNWSDPLVIGALESIRRLNAIYGEPS